MNLERTILTIVRHGQTSANLDGVWHGSTNTPLTVHGQRQATATAEFIRRQHHPVSRVYASPLDRAHHTAREIARLHSLTPELDPALAEYDLGAWEGMSFRDLHVEKKLFERMARDPHYAPHGGESPIQVGDRLAGALRRIAARHAGERVVVVTHGGALGIAFGVLLDDDYTRWNRMVGNCAVSELVLEPRPELLSFNQTAHLPADPDPAPHDDPPDSSDPDLGPSAEAISTSD